MTLQFIKGDVLNDAPCLKRKIIVHCCNNLGAMGSGVAKAIIDKYPRVYDEYVKWHKFEHYQLGTQTIPFELGQIQIVPVEKFVYIVNMIGQNGVVGRDNPKPVRYAAIIRCMEKVRKLCKKIDGEIHAPFFATGLAQGNKDTIVELINEIWHDLPVYIYTLE